MNHAQSDYVRIVEVGPRDGLQNEKSLVATADKIRFIDLLSESGLPAIEATSFVSPKWVPQLADAAEVYAGIRKAPGIDYPVLVPNLQGMQRALGVGVREIAVFGAASEAFSRQNINAGIDESLQRFEPVMALAKEHGVRVRGYVSTVLGCPYQGEVPLSDVVRVAAALYRMGCYEVSLGDTIGIGTPRKAAEMVRAVSAEVPVSALAAHYHDTRGQALANLLSSLDEGIRVVDASTAGLGGCPYAKGASGNVATEDVLYMLHGLGMRTGVNLDAVIAAGRFISEVLGRSTQSKVSRAVEGA